MRVRDYRDILVWQRAVEFVAEIYRLSAWFPRTEQFGLTAQLRRASVSVAANIAEGSGRATARDLMNFLSYARGSLNEAESMVFVAIRLKFVSAAESTNALRLADETSRMLAGLRTSIRKRTRNRQADHSPLATRHSPLVTRHSEHDRSGPEQLPRART